MEMYPGHSEDFAGANLAQLDTWVFDRVTVRLKPASSQLPVVSLVILII
jgi:hypothetical protein